MLAHLRVVILGHIFESRNLSWLPGRPAAVAAYGRASARLL